MSDENEQPEEKPEPEKVDFDLDAAEEREPTGDPLIDRGLKLSIGEAKEALADEHHPDHDAAVAAQAYLADKLKPLLNDVFGAQFKRIGENLAAAMRPSFPHLFEVTAKTDRILGKAQQAAIRPAVPPIANIGQLPVNETPRKTLEALVDVSEQMSEMVRVAAEHRDVAIRQAEQYEEDSKSTRARERRMLRLTWAAVAIAALAMIGTWVAVVKTP